VRRGSRFSVMTLFRLLLFLLIVGGIAAIAVQNLGLIHLVVLGQKTISLPLAVWLLGAMVLGSLTSIFLTGLIEWASFWSRRQERRSYRDNPPPVQKPKVRWNPFARSTEAEEDDPLDDSTWSNQPRPSTQTNAFRPPAPPREVKDADFRVIRPPSRSLDDE
jgi:uncharacterized integral membrane protein